MSYRAKRYREPIGNEVVGTVAELFAGVGGFRIGLSRSGWKTVFSNQWEPSTKAQHASECYVENFGPIGHSNEDIVSLVERHSNGPKSLIPKTDLLVGGFPCQDYSVAKSRSASKGLEGKKGVLWWSIRDLVMANKPKYVFLENVDRLLKSPATQKGRDFAIMLHTLSSLGYLIEWRVVNAAEYGFPQRRIRVFIVATKTRRKGDLQNSEALDIISNSGVLARALPVNQPPKALQIVDVSSSPDLLTKNFGAGLKKSPFLNSGVLLGGTAFTINTEPRFSGKRFVLADVLIPEAEVAEEYWIPSDKLAEWQYLKGAKSIARVHKASGTEYSYTEGKMAFPDLQTNPSRTILTGEGGSSPSRFKHIIKQGGRFRRLVPLELERLSGFPDHFTEQSVKGVISDARRAFFIGNALVVGLIERVGKVLAEDLASGKDK
jgi:DNA (cytosine-5)-methyltransferase 1